MSEYNMSHTGAQLDDAINKVQNGYILPIGNLTEDVLTVTTTSAHNTTTFPAGYYIDSDFSLRSWISGAITGSGTAGGTLNIPYASIGFIPSFVVLVCVSSSGVAANNTVCFFSHPKTSRYWYFGSTVLSMNTDHDDVFATMDSNGVTFPAISSSTKYAAVNYRWFALR